MQLEHGERNEYDRADKLTDEIELQLIDCSQEATERANSAGTSPPYNGAYPSAAIRKPRSFYNYIGEDLVPLLETDPDESLVRLAGGPGATTAHELFLPLQLQQKPSISPPPREGDSS